MPEEHKETMRARQQGRTPRQPAGFFYDKRVDMSTKKYAAGLAIAAIAGVAGLTACSSQADTVSSNISKDADSFKIEREIVFYNGITDKYVATVTGLCSIGNDSTDHQVNYTCKVGPDQYIKNFLHISDNVTWFALQVKPATSDPFHYEVILRPETVIPDVQVQTSGSN